MASGQTKLTICNAALDMLHETGLTSLADDRPVARWLSRNYDRLRDVALALHTWNFASARAMIAADGVGPAFGWKYYYTLPADFIRVHYVNADGKFNGTPVKYEVDGGKIATDQAAPLYLRYIKREVLEGNFDILFCQALAAIIAEALAHWITGKASYLQIAQQARADAVKQAKLLDSIQGTSQQVNEDEVITARFR